MNEKSPLQRITDAGFYGFAIGRSWNFEGRCDDKVLFTSHLIYIDGHQDIEGMVGIITDDLEKLLTATVEHAEMLATKKAAPIAAHNKMMEMLKQLSPEQLEQLAKSTLKL